MKRSFNLLLAVAVLALGTAASCTPNDTTTDSTTSNAAAAADTVGASKQLRNDATGVKLDSSSTKLGDKTGGPGATTDQAASQGQTK